MDEEPSQFYLARGDGKMRNLETRRLILRPFQDTDIEPFAAYRSDPEVARYQSWETPCETRYIALRQALTYLELEFVE